LSGNKEKNIEEVVIELKAECSHDWELRPDLVNSLDLLHLGYREVIVKVRCRYCGALGEEHYTLNTVREL